MLDAQELRRRLVLAMDQATPKVTSAAMATECRVTPQAVNGWRSTGRIAKKHLPKIAKLTGRPLEYFLEEEPAPAPAQGAMYRLAIEEAEAIKRLRDGNPDWRRYVLGLAMVERTQQDLLLNTMRQAVPDSKVERAYGQAPHVGEKTRK
jgi:transcriptional regulator with XRE-family HTH domain